MHNDAPPLILWQKAVVPVDAPCRCVGDEHSISESLAGLFPAAGSAPHVTILHPIHFTALLPLAPHLPAEEEIWKNADQVHV